MRQHDRKKCLTPDSRPWCAAEAQRSELLVVRLARFYSVMGHRPDEPGALALMAEMLTQRDRR